MKIVFNMVTYSLSGIEFQFLDELLQLSIILSKGKQNDTNLLVEVLIESEGLSDGGGEGPHC
jgi:hypothetical protein